MDGLTIAIIAIGCVVSFIFGATLYARMTMKFIKRNKRLWARNRELKKSIYEMYNQGYGDGVLAYADEIKPIETKFFNELEYKIEKELLKTGPEFQFPTYQFLLTVKPTNERLRFVEKQANKALYH